MKRTNCLWAAIGLLAFLPAPGRAQELLTNGNLNQTYPGDWLDLPTGWLLVTDPTETDPNNAPLRYPAFQAGYAEHTNPGGAGTMGLVLNSTEGDFPGYPDVILVDADLTQTVPGTSGQQYRMSGWAYFEGGFAGGVDTIATGTGTTRAGLPSLTDVFFALEFLDAGSNVLPGSITDYELRAHGQVNNPDTTEATRNWLEHVLTATAPAGTVSVRVRASMVDGEFNIDMPHQAAWVDDFSLRVVPEPATWLLGLLGLAAIGTVRRSR
ncbi:MAG: PEP-CTERM sorting domain-containing protein [Pirellulales bacterium]